MEHISPHVRRLKGECGRHYDCRVLFQRRNYYRPKPEPPRAQVIAWRIAVGVVIAMILIGGYLLVPGSWQGVYRR
jgi:hypothetical protein